MAGLQGEPVDTGPLGHWRREQLTFGSVEGRFHQHSYYDIPVLDATGRYVLAHRIGITDRRPTPEDAIELGLVDAGRPGSWEPLGESRAWSWQQGPLAQWIAGGPRIVWNDREPREGGDRFVARVVDLETGMRRTLPRPVYAVDPEGNFALSLDMARLDALRPGYGYPGGPTLGTARAPRDGVRRIELATGEERLLLPLRRAVRFLHARLGFRARARHALAGYFYWFNHAKIAPDGRRFTVKLRWRRRRGSWEETMGVSLTCGTDGEDLRLLADATSHVIWLDARRLYFWRRGRVRLYEDAEGGGREIGAIAPDLIDANVHIRHLPPDPMAEPGLFVLDTPYRETVDLMLYDARTGERARLARFEGHRPAQGEFRCDLHPVPSADGRRIVVASVADGGRQIYAFTRESD